VGAGRAVVAGAARASTRLPSAAGARPGRDGRDLVGAADGDAVERAERDRDLYLLLGSPSLPRVGAGRGVPRGLAAGFARLRRADRDRLGLVVVRRGDRESTAWGRGD